MKNVPYWTNEYSILRYKKQLRLAFEKVINSGQLILGPRVDRFEQDFAKYIGTNYAVGVDNATNAIFLSLKAGLRGCQPKNKSKFVVATVPNTAVPTCSAIHQAGCLVEFFDIDEGTFQMNESSLVPELHRLDAVVWVHLYGACTDLSKLRAECDEHGVLLLEDCSQSHGSRIDGRFAGTYGHLSIFSFYPTKVLGGLGDGGLIATNDAEKFDDLRRLRFYGMQDSYFAKDDGYNCRLDELQAAFLSVRLDALDVEIKSRVEIAERYEEGITNSKIIKPQFETNLSNVFYTYVIRCAHRTELQKYLSGKGIGTKINYPWLVSEMPPFEYGAKRSLENAQQASKNILSLPMYPFMSQADALTVVEQVNSF